MSQSVIQIPERDTLSRIAAAELRAEAARQGISHREIARRMKREQSWLSRKIGVTATSELSLEDLAEITEGLGLSLQAFLSVLLPRLDSNQQPSGYQPERLAPVTDLFTGQRVA